MHDRISPLIPPFAFSVDGILPVNYDASAVGDLPIHLYRRQRLLRALGCLPSGVELPPAISVPARQDIVRPAAGGQFRGALSVAVWNAQAFFATNDHRHSLKWRIYIA